MLYTGLHIYLRIYLLSILANWNSHNVKHKTDVAMSLTNETHCWIQSTICQNIYVCINSTHVICQKDP